MAGQYITARVDGLAELKQALDGLVEELRSRAMRDATSAAAGVIRAEIKAVAPVGETQRLRSAVFQVRERSAARDVFTYHVGIRAGKRFQRMGKDRKTNLDAYYWKFLEFGHYTRTPGNTRATGKRARIVRRVLVGKAKWVPGLKFVRRSFELRKQDAVLKLRTVLEARIRRYTAQVKKPVARRPL